jgi:hypothetical protein
MLRETVAVDHENHTLFIVVKSEQKYARENLDTTARGTYK